MSLVKMIAFDLETIADKSIIPLLPPIEADSRNRCTIRQSPSKNLPGDIPKEFGYKQQFRWEWQA